MKMKYFRFLYGETKNCMIHFGEVKDDRSKETLTFLFLRGDKENANLVDGPHYPFKHPDTVDVVIFGNLNQQIRTVWNEMRESLCVKTIIIPEGPEADEMQLDQAERVIRLKVQDQSGWNITKAGWMLKVICWTEGGLALWHDTEQVFQNVEKAGAEEIAEFEDCVMNMKAIDENSRCCENRNPDEYGCALGCTLRKDYDVCKFRYVNRANPYLTGTVLTAGTGNVDKGHALNDWLRNGTGRIRFFALQDLESKIWQILSAEKEQESGARKYFVNTAGEVSDKAIADICRNGFKHMPILLQEGRGVCCSGFFKYQEM